jgi:2',3'-cyclic-nucleotide 2'-phosphodiesterase (5'-nucleotidase family)
MMKVMVHTVTGLQTDSWEVLGNTACGARVWKPSAQGIALPMRKKGAPPEILYFNDTHGGLGRLLPLLDTVTNGLFDAGSEWLTVSGGDDHGGGSVWDAGFFLDAHDSLAFSLLKLASVDVCVPGNHDFDWGWKTYAERTLKGPSIYRVVANLSEEAPQLPDHFPYLMIEFKNHLMAITGVLCMDQTREAMRYLKPPQSILIPLVRQLGQIADSVMVLSHLGYASRSGEYADLDVLSDLGDDILLAGAHTHDVRPSPGCWNFTNYLQCGEKGAYLGRIRNELGKWKVRIETVKDSNRTVPEEITQRLNLICNQAQSIDFPEAAGRSENPACDGYRGECVTINAVTDAMMRLIPEASGHLAALCVRSFSSRPIRGKMTILDWIECLPYGDALCSIRVPITCLPKLLELNALRLRGPAHYLETSGFLHFSRHLTYQVEVYNRECRVNDIQLNGKALKEVSAPDISIVMLTQAYVAEGMGGYVDLFAQCLPGWSRAAVQYEDICIRERLWMAFKKLSFEERSAFFARDERFTFKGQLNSEGSGNSAVIH